MEKQLLKELIEDMDDIILHSAGETKNIAGCVRSHLRTELTLEEEQEEKVIWQRN